MIQPPAPAWPSLPEVMKRSTLILLLTTLLLIGATAGLLSYQKEIQTLGEPGVQVVATPVFDPEGNVAGTHSVPLPDRLLDCDSEVRPIAREVLDWLPPDTTYAQRLYQDTNHFQMLVNVVLMGGDRTSIHKPEYCLVGSGWGDHHYLETNIVIHRPHTYDLPVRRVDASRVFTFESGQELERRGIYVYWFVADGEMTARHGERMWSMARHLVLTGELQRWAYISAFSVCAPGQEESTYARMAAHIAELVPQIQLTTGPALADNRQP